MRSSSEALRAEPARRVRVLRGESAVAARPSSEAGPGPAAALVPAWLEARLEAARAEGFEQGRRHEAAEREAAERGALEDHRQALVASIGRIADEVVAGRTALVSHVEAEVSLLAFRLTSVLLDRELELASSPGLDAVRRALRLAPESGEITLRLNPLDAEALDGSDELAELLGLRSFVVVADGALARGDCVAAAGSCRIEAQIGPALERVRAVLEGAGGTGGGAA